MALFDIEEEPDDDVEKSRLFDTVKSSGRSVRDYVKVLLPVVVVVILAGAVVVYFTAPGVGDEVRPADSLAASVRTHFQEREKREVSEATYFLCDDFYSARVQLEKRPDVTARKMDEGKRRITAVDKGDGQWEITSAVDNETYPPCAR